VLSAAPTTLRSDRLRGRSSWPAIYSRCRGTTPPSLDWIDIATRSSTRRRQQTVCRLTMQAKIVIVEGVGGHCRIWNRKNKNVKRSIDRVRKVMHLQGERGLDIRTARPRRLRHPLFDVASNSEARVLGRVIASNCAMELPSTSEAQTFSRRMNKQQMRWSRKRDLLLQVAAGLRMGRPVSITVFTRLLERAVCNASSSQILWTLSFYRA
jgi:hypothetical protein